MGDDAAVKRFKERVRLIDNDEFSTGFYTDEDYCARMKKHIDKMNQLRGDHLKDIEYYKNQMRVAGCTKIPSGGSRRRASKHSKKSKKSRKYRKTKSRRH